MRARAAVKPGTRAPYEVAVRWETASELVATVPRGANLDQVRTVMDAAARAEGRTVASVWQVGRRMVGWCPLVSVRREGRAA